MVVATLRGQSSRKRTIRVLSVLILVIILLSTVEFFIEAYGVSKYRWIRSVTIIVPAVEETPKGLVGVASSLTVTIAWPGTGEVYISTSPLASTDTQASGRLAILIAALLAGINYHSYDFFIKYNTSSLFIGGPSASGATAVAALAAIYGIKIPSNFSMTGMIGPDGSLNPVGGIPEKLEAAASQGVKLFVIPAGQGIVIDENTGQKVDVHEIGSKLGVKVIEASTIVDVIEALAHKRIINITYSKLKYPDWLSSSLKNAMLFFKKLATGNITYIEENIKPLRGSRYYSLLEKELEEAKKLVSEGERLYSQNLFYSAASRMFMAAWHATFAAELLKTLLSDDPLASITTTMDIYSKAARNLIERSENIYQEYVARRKISDIGIQIAVTLYDRLDSARILLSEASEATDPIQALQATIIAYYRGLTALQWASLLQRVKDLSIGEPINWFSLQDSVNDFIRFAEATLAYLRSLGMAVSLNSLDKATEMLREGDPIAASSIAISSLSYGMAILHAAFNTLQQRLIPTINATKLLVSRVNQMGITPILPLMYMEYASRLEATSINDAISLYATASSYSLLLYMTSSLRQSKEEATNTSSSAASSKQTSSGSATTLTTTTVTTVVERATTTVTVYKQNQSSRTIIVEDSSSWLYPMLAIIIVVIAFAVLCMFTRPRH